MKLVDQLREARKRRRGGKPYLPQPLNVPCVCAATLSRPARRFIFHFKLIQRRILPEAKVSISVPGRPFDAAPSQAVSPFG